MTYEQSNQAQISSRPKARVKVLLPLPLGNAYDYGIPEALDLSPGDFVKVPLGPRQAVGVVWENVPQGAESSVSENRLKDVISRMPAPPMPAENRQLVDWISAYTLSPPGAVLRMAMSVPAALEPAKPRIAYTCADPLPEIRMTAARQRVIDVLQSMPPLLPKDIANEAAVGPSVVKGLIETNVLDPVALPPGERFTPPDPNHPGPTLSSDQAEAAESMRTKAEGFSVTLLDGVTGAGKTEVYFEAIAEALKHGKQALVMLPEIALSAQWLGRFEARFGVRPAEWHSDLTQAKRHATWRAIAEGNAQVVVGARSALFLPYPELGLIVVDEEHDAAFKQEDGVAYHARDMAVVRARIGDIPLVLASATPSLETVANVEAGRYDRLRLETRHGGATLPQIELVDLRQDKPARQSWVSPTLRRNLAENLATGAQSLLFLNRRGYAPLTLCRSCGHRLECPNCTAWLVEHRFSARLQCHHCGYSGRRPDECTSCGTSDSLVACGPGVERLAEEVMNFLPEARICLATSDSIRKPSDAATFVSQVLDHEVDIVIGTQIVAKGYHFPKLTLVGVVDADLGLAGGDLRAAERTYQLLHQVAGRAGRDELPGRVLLQTYHPEHPVMQAMAAGNRDSFLEAEAWARQAGGWPPYGRLAALVISGRDPDAVAGTARALARCAPTIEGVRILGPALAPLSVLRGRHRWRLLMKAERGISVQDLLRQWLPRVLVPNAVKVQVDVDPHSFL
jgi:primosomal protein N' (replication factor Y)